MGEKLTDAEADFVGEMSFEDDHALYHWQNFDPDFRQGDIARLIRRGWFEKRGKPPHREYRWTDKGRAALTDRGQGEGSDDAP